LLDKASEKFTKASTLLTGDTNDIAIAKIKQKIEEIEKVNETANNFIKEFEREKSKLCLRKITRNKIVAKRLNAIISAISKAKNKSELQQIKKGPIKNLINKDDRRNLRE
jgi:hypothetical protein